MAMDEGDGGAVVLWDLEKMGEIARATGSSRLQRCDDLVFRQLRVVDEHVTWLSRVKLSQTYLICGSYDGKLKVIGETGQQVGQLVPDGE